MNNKPTVKLIKNAELKKPGIPMAVETLDGPNRWSEAVRSWIVDFQERDRTESLPAFDSLFRDALRPSSTGAESSWKGKIWR